MHLPSARLDSLLQQIKRPCWRTKHLSRHAFGDRSTTPAYYLISTLREFSGR
jgi:hypothetical protein